MLTSRSLMMLLMVLHCAYAVGCVVPRGGGGSGGDDDDAGIEGDEPGECGDGADNDGDGDYDCDDEDCAGAPDCSGDDDADDDDAADDDDDAADDDDDAADDDDDAADDDDTSSECWDNTDCASNEICLNDACESAMGRQYTLTVGSGELTIAGPNSDGNWDPGAGAPDGFVVIWIDGSQVLTTSTVTDSYTPGWYESVDQILTSSTEVGVEVYDYDPTSGDDWACGWTIDPVAWAHQAGILTNCSHVIDLSLFADPVL